VNGILVKRVYNAFV